MKTLQIFGLLLGAFLAAQAQAGKPSKAEIDRAFKAQTFVQTLTKAAAPEGKNMTASLGFSNEMQQWSCSVRVSGNGTDLSVTTTHPSSPERACVSAVLALSKQMAL